ncbi:MAG: polysaccharide deacetylase family protein [Candidatus Pelethousia sp.]|nr:polysaccharide deacetylase family protein [Candidatus Pelethousia sp.]
MRKSRKAGQAVINLLLILLIAGLYIGTVQPQVLSVSAPVYRGSAKDAVALQFAVSWNAAALPGILDTLKAQNVQATFALSGQWAEQNPELVRRMAQEGHELATMGYAPEQDGNLSWVLKDLTASLSAIEGVAGVRPTLYYSGSRAASISARASKKLEITQVLCTVDLLSARGSAADIINRVSDTPIPGSIMLLQPTGAAAEALSGILQTLQEKGIKPTTTGAVLGRE